MDSAKDNNIMTKKGVGFRNWISFILIGLAGQFAWMIENMYLNKFIFSFGGSNYTDMITITVAVSAIIAALTTIFMGGLSDKIGRRKLFIIGGYILWGLATAGFGLIHASGNIGPTEAAIFVIILDGVMTFFGSTANDACFNSYVTKNVEDKNRGKVEGVLSILPLVTMLIIFVFMNGLTDKNSEGIAHWDIFFYIIGGIVLLTGIASIFLLPKEKVVKSEEKYFSLLTEGFKPQTVKHNKMLYLVLLAYLVYGISTQIFFPYLTIYFQYSLGFEGMDFSILFGCMLIIGSALTVVCGIVSDKIGKFKTLIPVAIISFIGFIIVYFVQAGQLVFAIIAGIIMIFGYIGTGSVLNSILRELIPHGKEGVFMGIRMLFVVLIPMCTGPYIGQAITDNFATKQYVSEFGVKQNLPPAIIWIVGSLVFLLIFIPITFMLLLNKKNTRLERKNNE